MLPYWCLPLVLLTLGNGQVAPSIDTGILPEIFVHGDHFSVGQQIGFFTKDYIKPRLSSLLPTLEWVLATEEGMEAYEVTLNSAYAAFPEYVEELEGMAYGSGIEFKTLFVLNTRNELSNFKSKRGKGSSKSKVEHCSDYLVNAMESGGTSKTILIGHNEDGDMQSRDISFLITVHISGDKVREEIKFTSFVYPGELPTDAFFWNEYGVIGTMNGLYPVENLYGGLGRNFVSRDLVGATSIEDAIARVTIPNQATGHSYNFASKQEPVLLNVEVGPGTTGDRQSLYSVTYVPSMSGAGTKGTAGSLDTNVLFHANKYIFLNVDEEESDSSDHRMVRAAELPPPACGTDVLTVLGDTADADWPIYRSATGSDTGYTLVTALFSVDFSASDMNGASTASTVTLYMKNPKTTAEVHVTKPLEYFA